MTSKNNDILPAFTASPYDSRSLTLACLASLSTAASADGSETRVLLNLPADQDD